jgi:hypothetical protein
LFADNSTIELMTLVAKSTNISSKLLLDSQNNLELESIIIDDKSDLSLNPIIIL